MLAISCSTWMTKGQWTQRNMTRSPCFLEGPPVTAMLAASERLSSQERAKTSSRDMAWPVRTSVSSKAGAVVPSCTMVDSVRDIWVSSAFCRRGSVGGLKTTYRSLQSADDETGGCVEMMNTGFG